MKVALLFIDGVGIGRRDRAVNPLAKGDYLLSQFDDGSGEPLTGGQLFAVDPTFRIPGRPQSATNQTAILTGEPAPAIIGKHVLGFPNAPLRSLLGRKSIVKRMVEQRRSATFANCYPAGYLDVLGLNHRPSRTLDVVIPQATKRRLRPSATTLAMAAGGVALRTFDDARRDEGLTHDIDGARAASRGFDVPRRTADQPSNRLRAGRPADAFGCLACV